MLTQPGLDVGRDFFLCVSPERGGVGTQMLIVSRSPTSSKSEVARSFPDSTNLPRVEIGTSPT
jgi:hypothetical protein